MEHRRLVLEDARSRLEQLGVRVPARDANELLVDVGPGDQDPELHATSCGVGERIGERGARREVGGGQVKGLPGRGDREVVERFDIRVADARVRADQLHPGAIAALLEVRQVVLAAQDLAGGLQPVLGEGALEPADDRPPYPDVGVAPVVGVLCVAGPLLGDADAARHAHRAVGDQHPPMRAVREAPQGVGADRAEPAHLDSGILHLAGSGRGP